MQNLIFSIGSFVGAHLATFLIGALSGVWATLQTSFLRAKKPPVVEDATRADTYIYEQLSAMRARMGSPCLRVYLSKYHNGDHYIDGSEILKTSRTHEVVADGVSFQSSQYTNVLISTLPSENELIVEDGPGYRIVRDLPDDKFKWMCRMGGVSAVARAAIRCQDKTIGFVGVDFDNEVRPDNLNDLCELAGRIGVVLKR